MEDSPLERRDWDTDFLLVISGLCVMFPLSRGDKGVCYGEMCGLGRDDFCCCLGRWYFLCLV